VLLLLELLNQSEEMKNKNMFGENSRTCNGHMVASDDQSIIQQGEQWSTVERRRKRARQNIDSVEKETYETFDVNTKLNVLFSKIQTIERSQAECRLQINLSMKQR